MNILMSTIGSIILYGFLGILGVAIIVFAFYKMYHPKNNKNNISTKSDINYDDAKSIYSHTDTDLNNGVYEPKVCKECGHIMFLKIKNKHRCCFCGHEYNQQEAASLFVKEYNYESVSSSTFKKYAYSKLNGFNDEYKENFKRTYGFTLETYFNELVSKDSLTGSSKKDHDEFNGYHFHLMKDYILWSDDRGHFSGVEKECVLNPLEYLKTHLIKISSIKGVRPAASGMNPNMSNIILENGPSKYIEVYKSVDEINKFYSSILNKREEDESINRETKILEEFKNKYGLYWGDLQNSDWESASITLNINDDYALNSSASVWVCENKVFLIGNDNFDKLQNLLKDHIPDLEAISKILFTSKDILKLERSTYDDRRFVEGHKPGLADYALGSVAAGAAGVAMAAMTYEDDKLVSHEIPAINVYVPKYILESGAFKVRRVASFENKEQTSTDKAYNYFDNLI